MRVVFLENVPGIAKTGDVKEVADGYARNYLIPRKLASLVTSQATSRLEAQLDSRVKKQAKMAENLSQVADQLNGKEITIKVKVGAKGRLYGSITSADIAAELSRATGVEIDKRKVELSETIRELGSYDVAIRLAKDTLPKIKVIVSGQEPG